MAQIGFTLNDQEQTAFLQLIDMTLRNAGINALSLSSYFKSKIDAALQAEQATARAVPLAQNVTPAHDASHDQTASVGTSAASNTEGPSSAHQTLAKASALKA